MFQCHEFHLQHYQKKFPDLVFKELSTHQFEVVCPAEVKPLSPVELKEQGGTCSTIFTFETLQDNTWGQPADQIPDVFMLHDVQIFIDGKACVDRCKVKSSIQAAKNELIPHEDPMSPAAEIEASQKDFR